MEYLHDRPYNPSELCNPWMDKLFLYQFYEIKDGEDRRTSTHHVAQGYMETMAPQKCAWGLRKLGVDSETVLK